MRETTILRRLWSFFVKSYQQAAVVRFVAVAAVGAALGAGALHAYDPTPVLRNLYGANYAVGQIFEVKASKESAFVDSMVANGPFNKMMTGFVNERIIRLISNPDSSTVRYISVARYFDKATAEVVISQRNPEVRKYLATDPTQFKLSLVEHILGNWGWENGSKESTIRSVGLQNDQIFRENISSLSFFKGGYVGQVGMLEFPDPGSTIEQVRASLSGRKGLSGASIFTIDGSTRFAVYCEYFKTPSIARKASLIMPASQDTESLPLGAQAGVVVQNYVPR